ncbi:hypothetical protein P175DRAFT_0503250 [Aspergillus ochraceoroseus IBT 24754]|uniref:Uncharacterized protein n=3 Tax=Aspergillus subgen. Nidulantes TaxID=2720870 RepID=A0A0F8WUX7_9EURO|nr:uncharacterized protein P175DRAFT_0503250 [Aspergillus ochraceoroseus IBT 24754]KKK19015.1 hypothetical protein AOCH_005282 [Aspergillus ochraceoroseus]KKK21400.1 hypothetical protein ARAM_007162 [Aspergillus rambellii]PTU19732.1 hypothetical protein P175DRAFT_0503250 [Aspergillus ochraceoroseus IBT 24754]
MANQVSLLTYLQVALPAIPANPPQPSGPNTTNDSYSFQDIHNLTIWEEFNLANILQTYQTVLTTSSLAADPFPTSPPNAINSENPLRHRITEMISTRLRRALRTGFASLSAVKQMNGLTILSFDVGEAARTIGTYTPDIAYFTAGSQPGTSWNRAPGDVKPSWKWDTAMSSGTNYQRKEYRQALSQS